MSLRLGDTAPNFIAETTEGTVDFHPWMGNSWAVLFSHPKDFTPVCTTEIGEVARLKGEFERRNVRVIGLSVDSVAEHRYWIRDIEETQNCKVNFPLIGDPDRSIAKLYDMIHPGVDDTSTVRAVFVIGPDKRIKLTMAYPAGTGRNFQEILRVIDALQLTEDFSVATPANWRPGNDVIIVSSVSDEEARKKFPGGWTAVKPYLRIVHAPQHFH